MDITRIREDNDRDMHLLLTPVREARKALSILKLILGCIALFMLSNLGWIVGIGDRGIQERQAMIQDLQSNTSPDTNQGWVRYTVDFSHRPAEPDGLNSTGDLDPCYVSTNHLWEYVPDDPRMDCEEKRHSMKAFTSTSDSSRNIVPAGIPYCQNDPGYWAMDHNQTNKSRVFDTRLGTWRERGHYALDRKSSRMARDYETGAMMTAALRATVTLMKLGLPLSYAPPMDMEHAWKITTFCNVDAPLNHISNNPDLAQRFIATSMHLRMPDAPSIQFEYVYRDKTEPNHDPSRVVSGMQITGMCLDTECEEQDRLPMVTWYRDLFASNPPLNEHQVHAEQRLLAMQSAEVWKATALANGVRDLQTVEQARQQALRSLDYVLGDYWKN